jgi:hypothetical protein
VTANPFVLTMRWIVGLPVYFQQLTTCKIQKPRLVIQVGFSRNAGLVKIRIFGQSEKKERKTIYKMENADVLNPLSVAAVCIIRSGVFSFVSNLG